MILYQKDLSFVHDNSYSEIAVESAKTILKNLKKSGHSEGLIINLGCGSGKLAAELTKENYRVIGVDLSKDMIELARKNAPQAEFIHQSFLDFEFPKCVCVTAIGEVFTYLFDERNDLNQLKNLFQKVYDSSKKGGVFIFDLLEPNILKNENPMRKLVETKDWTMHVTYSEDKIQNTFERDIILFRKTENGLYRKSREVHKVKLYESDLILAKMNEIGFKTQLIRQYGDLKFRENHYGIIGIK